MVGHSTLIDQREAARLEQLAVSVSHQAPPWAALYIKKAAPALGVFGAMAEALGPIMYKFYAALYEIYKKLPTNVVTCLYGLGVCFYGGRYPLTIAAGQAFRLTGGGEMAAALTTIKQNLLAAQRASAEEEAVSERGVQRKLALAVRAVEPTELTDAVGSLWSGYMGVLAALKLKFARATALAHSLGDSLRPAAAKVLGPTLLSLTPPEHHKWVSPGLNVFCKVLGLTVAWKLQRSLSTFQSALSGGLLAARTGLLILREQQIVNVDADQTMADEVVGYSLAAGGIYYQMFLGGSPPMWLFPVLMPLGFVESCLQYSVILLGGKEGSGSS